MVRSIHQRQNPSEENPKEGYLPVREASAGTAGGAEGPGMQFHSVRAAELRSYQQKFTRKRKFTRRVDQQDMEDAGLAGLDEAAPDPQSILNKAWLISTIFELFLVCVATGLFYERNSVHSTLYTMWGTLVVVFLLRVLLNCVYARDDEKRRQRAVMTMTLLPYVLYLPLLFDAFVHKCLYEVKISSVEGVDLDFLHIVTVHSNSTSYATFTTRCHGAFPASIMFAVQGASQLVLPTLFAYMFVTLGGLVWSLDLLANEVRTLLQLSMLNLLDCVTFITLPVYPATFVFLAHNPECMVIVTVCFVVGFLCCILKNLLASPEQTVCWNCRWKESLSWTFYMKLTALVIDIPFLIVRLFFVVHVGCTVSIPMMIKNIICLANTCCVVAFGPDNALSLLIHSVLNMLPGTQTVQGETAKRIFLQFKGDLDQHKQTLDEMQRQEDQIKDKIQLVQTQNKALEFIKDVMYKRVPYVESDVLEKNFEVFDFDRSGYLDEQELEKIFDTIDQEASIEVDRMMAECKQKDARGAVHISDFTRVFLQWRDRGDLLLDGDEESLASGE